MTDEFQRHVHEHAAAQLHAAMTVRETAVAATIDAYETGGKNLYMIVDRHPSLGVEFNRGEFPMHLAVDDGPTWSYATEGPGFAIYVRPRRWWNRDDRRRWRTETRAALRLADLA